MGKDSSGCWDALHLTPTYKVDRGESNKLKLSAVALPTYREATQLVDRISITSET